MNNQLFKFIKELNGIDTNNNVSNYRHFNYI